MAGSPSGCIHEYMYTSPSEPGPLSPHPSVHRGFGAGLGWWEINKLPSEPHHHERLFPIDVGKYTS